MRKPQLVLSKNVWVMGFVSLLNDLSSEIVFPLVPIFLTSVLGAPVAIVGFIEGVSDALANFLMAISGFFSDKLQRRWPFIFTGYGLSTLSKLLLSISYGWPMVMLGRVTNRLGKGVRTTARDALITESTGKTIRGMAFGLHRTMDTIGAIAGPFAAMVLLNIFSNNYRHVFFWAFIPSALAMLLLLLVDDKRQELSSHLKMRFEWHKANFSFKLFLFISFVFTLGNSSIAFLILRAQNLGLTVGQTMLAYVMLSTTSALFSIPAGIISDRIGAKRVLFFGYLLFSYIYMMLGLINTSHMVWILFPAYGLFLSLTDGVSRAYISRLVPHKISASAFGIYQVVIGVTIFLSSYIAGMLWSLVSPSTPFIFGSVMAFVAASLFYLLSRWIRVHPESYAEPVR